MFVVIEETHDGDLFRGVFRDRRAAEAHANELRAMDPRSCFTVVDEEGPHNPNS